MRRRKITPSLLSNKIGLAGFDGARGYDAFKAEYFVCPAQERDKQKLFSVSSEPLW